MNAPPERNLHPTATFRICLRKCGAAVRIRISSVLLNYRCLVGGGQRLRCHFANLALLNGDTRRGIQDTLDKDVERFGQGLAFALEDRRLFFEEA
jgi:hypothetical protein